VNRGAPLRIVVLGGGTAGWMAANLIAHRWRGRGVTVTVVESPDIGIIGVGEGSTPQLKAMFDTLGIAEADWMPACNATYKTGIAFHDWSTRPGFERYFHPFPTNLDHHTAPSFYFNTRARRTGRDVCAHPDRFFLPAKLAAERRAPIAPPSFPFAIGYGYHFDATLVGQFLRDHAVTKLGVTHMPRTVQSVGLNEHGVVTGLRLDDDETINGDFFIDSSGFRATIIQGALDEAFVPFGSNLFNDRAIAMPTSNDPGPIRVETRATAMANGWAWKIPLTNRTGNGYVYASAFVSADAAETELRTALGMLDSDVSARHLTMNVGQVRRSWVKNCLAVGLSQGFIEPLEATALHIVQATVEGFMDAYEVGDFTDKNAPTFNADIAARYEGIRDYIVAHYRMNQRTDTEYWRANAANQNLSDSLKGIMTCWFKGGDLSAEIAAQNIARYYPALSWHCLFAGYGTYPDDAKLRAPEAGLEIADMATIDGFVAGCAMNFPGHDTALATVSKRC
jgi:tryptophan 6-halogenase